MTAHPRSQANASGASGRRRAERVAVLIVLCTIGVLAAATARAASPRLPNASVELHTHLFMKPGLGWLFRGSFDEPLTASDWDDRLSCKANATTLDRSGVGVAVVALFAHPLYVADMRESVRKQVRAARRFCATHPRWELARDAAQARQILLSGKRAMVLSLEGASGVIESEADLAEFIDELGIAIVTPLHLVDDRYGGVAAIGGFQRLANPLGMVDGLLDPQAANVTRNPRGLTPLGRRLLVELVARGVWIDLTHASDRAVTEMLPLLRRARQPLLFSHTAPRRHRAHERALPDAWLAEVARSGGVVGLLPSEDGFADITVARDFCPAGCALKDCQGSVHALAQIHRDVSRVIGADAVMLGSDHNGGMRHLAAACGTGTSLDRPPGLWNIGQQAELWTALKRVGAPVPPLRRTLAKFLSAWTRVKPQPKGPLLATLAPGRRRLPRLPRRRDASGPGAEVTVSAGAAYLQGRDGASAGAISVGASLLVLKDMARAQRGEPALYYAKLSGSATSVPFSGEVELVDAHVAPVGARARWYDNQLWGDALAARLWRNSALDQAFAAQWLLLRGGVRTMPGLLKRPGHHNLFLGIGAGAIGYKLVDRISTAGLLHGFVPVEGSAELGASFWPAADMRVTLFGWTRADVALAAFSPLRYQTDVAFAGGIRLGLPDGVVEPYVDIRWLLAHQGGEGTPTAAQPWRSSRQLHSGARIRF